MGSAPQQPEYKAPSGKDAQKPFIPTGGIDIQQLQNAYQNATNPPGSTNISSTWNASGLPGLPNAQGIASPEGQAVAADTIGYQMSDADLAARYPWLMQARNTYGGLVNDVLGNQTPTSVAAGQSAMSSGAAMQGTGNQVIGQGQAYLPQSQTLIDQGQTYFPTSQSLIGQGQTMIGQSDAFLKPAAELAGAAKGVGQQDIDLGQQMVNGQAMDPLVQQELMRAGLSSAAGSLGGAAALGGTAGQAAVGRQLGVGAQNWINQQRTLGQALQTTGAGLTSSYGGTAANLAGAGAGVAGAGSNVVGAGTGVGNLGNAIIGSGVNVGGLGSSLIGQGGSLYGQGTNAITAGQGVINNANQNANATFGEASSLFQPRTFGLSGADAANVALSNTTGQNNMNQYTYAQAVQGAQYNSQIAGANASAQSQASGNMISGGATVGASAAAIGAAFALSCWVAMACFGPNDPRFFRFRFWMMNLAPRSLRSLYMRHGKKLALFIVERPMLKSAVKLLLETILACPSAKLIAVY